MSVWLVCIYLWYVCIFMCVLFSLFYHCAASSLSRFWNPGWFSKQELEELPSQVDLYPLFIICFLPCPKLCC